MSPVEAISANRERLQKGRTRDQRISIRIQPAGGSNEGTPLIAVPTVTVLDYVAECIS